VTILDEILERKRAEVAALDAGALRAGLAGAPPLRDFAGALEHGPSPRVIAEFKRRSPSKGVIREGAEPAEIARAYAASGAAALSVLTDRDFFGGGLEDLRAAREACALPVLRKDFMVDACQLTEARAAGADAVLLIVSALDDGALADLHAAAADLGLAVLVEVHTHEEVDRAHSIGARLIGINNRDLHSFKTDVAVTRALLPHVAVEATVVSESGLDDPDVVRALEGEGVAAFLVGEALMREPDPGAALRALRGVA
jgi:indole-3-glycerol phosphate synthase